MDDRWEPSNWEPEPDLRQGYRAPPRSALSDRDNSQIFHATEEFHQRMSDHEVEIGRELTGAEKIRHIQKFEGLMFRTYGAARADGAWLSRHEAWQRRNQRGGGFDEERGARS